MVQSVNFITNYLSILQTSESNIAFFKIQNMHPWIKDVSHFFFFFIFFASSGCMHLTSERRTENLIFNFVALWEIESLLCWLSPFVTICLISMAWHKISTCEGISIRMLTVHCHLCRPSFDFWASTYSTLLLVMFHPPTKKTTAHV